LRHSRESLYRDSDLLSACPSLMGPTKIIDHLHCNAVIGPRGTLVAESEHATAQKQHRLYRRYRRLIERTTQELFRSTKKSISGGLLVGWIVVYLDSVGELRDRIVHGVEEKMRKVRATGGHITCKHCQGQPWTSSSYLRGRYEIRKAKCCRFQWRASKCIARSGGTPSTDDQYLNRG
jgi:hypothetical protein